MFNFLKLIFVMLVFTTLAFADDEVDVFTETLYLDCPLTPHVEIPSHCRNNIVYQNTGFDYKVVMAPIVPDYFVYSHFGCTIDDVEKCRNKDQLDHCLNIPWNNYPTTEFNITQMERLLPLEQGVLDGLLTESSNGYLFLVDGIGIVPPERKRPIFSLAWKEMYIEGCVDLTERQIQSYANWDLQQSITLETLHKKLIRPTEDECVVHPTQWTCGNKNFEIKSISFEQDKDMI